MTVDQSTLDRWRLYHVLGHVRRTQVWAARLGSKLGLNIDTFLKEDTFQQRVLVAEHQAFVGSCSMGSLEVM